MKRCIYIYRDSDQPRTGWFHACFLCYTTTGQTLLFDEVKRNGFLIEKHVYVCPDCKKILQCEEDVLNVYKETVTKYLHYNRH